MKPRKISRQDDVLLMHLSNKLASYHQTIRDNFNFGNNRYYISPDHRNWLFDPNIIPIYHMDKDRQVDWFSSANSFSVYAASEGINPLADKDHIQRTGICLIESAEIKALENRIKDGNMLSEKEAIQIMNGYPTESQLLGVKPVLSGDIVVYLEDVLFEELWDKFTGGKYKNSKIMQDTFAEQIERTKKIIEKYVSLIHPDSCPEIQFIKYSDIWEGLQNGVHSWIEELLEETPYTYDDEFYIPNAASVLYSYGGKNLAKISSFDETKDIVLVIVTLCPGKRMDKK